MTSTAAPNTPSGSHDLIHNDEHHEAITRVVAIAVDSSPHSQHALEWAISNVLKPASDLVILMNTRPVAIIPGPYGSAYMDFSNYIVQLEEQNRAASHTLLRKAAAELKAKKFAVKAISLRGDPREELTRKIEELNCDLLIIGSRGLGAIKRMFLGSVSQHLIHHCHCPVIVVKDTAVSSKDSASPKAVSEPVPAALH